MSEKVKLILFNVALAVTIIGTFYWCSERTDEEIKERIETVNNNYEYSKGIITDINYYKGRTIRVKYRISERIYEASLGWDKNPENLDEGDSIRLRYSVEKPDLIILELENEY
ncbi:hypothetical protein ACD591_21180 [Rufibacter glacialis]|uniref:DUF3592 domain-containing protein n=1 Tax=Rufibacter glacialis TaxID=1259555 RepID=A0A5M8QPC1_9BACT|nr:hypothetical protein [Rufibacter glacialis]KAA6438015.1 hypothetical protein FOE74_00850 [Rufibacter glacialis]GGK89612.1 hypothetical protein GCM10011405_41650 [Rufibacter glacialis]